MDGHPTTAGVAAGILERVAEVDRFWVIGLVAAVLLAAGLARGILQWRAGRRRIARESLAVVAGASFGFAGVAASVLLAPRGLSPRLWDPALLLSALGLGWWRPLRGGGFWLGCALGLVAGAVAVPMALPSDPLLAGADGPRAGGAAEVGWSLDGARVRIDDPLDPPREFVNGQRTDLSIAPWRELAARSAAACPDGADEERAALEAFDSGNLDRAVARGRLALQICERPPLARAVVGEALLRRAVTALRTGRPKRAAEDLAEADGLIDDPKARTRLSRARARLESAAPPAGPNVLPEPISLPRTE